MMELTSRQARNMAIGVCVLSAALLAPRFAAAADAPKAPTFTKDIAPIFQEKCEACHRPNSIAPMSLVSFAEARPWARSIKARVTDHQMPPWQIDRTVGIQKFKNDRSFLNFWMPTVRSICHGGIWWSTTRALIDRAHGRASANVISDIGAIESGR